jgi:hypothetical protein
VTEGQGNGSKQLLDDLIQTARYWKVKDEVLDRAVWRIRFGRDYGPEMRRNVVSGSNTMFF